MKGKPNRLSESDEKDIFDWIVLCSERGFPRTTKQVLHQVQKAYNLLHADTWKPSTGWLQGFLRKNGQLKRKKPQVVTLASSTVTEGALRAYLARTYQYAVDKNLLTVLMNPRRVLNADETYFAFFAVTVPVITGKDEKRPVLKNSNPKATMSVMMTAAADGTFLEPFVIFKGDRTPPGVAKNTPSDIKYTHTADGWMNGSCFLEYLEKVVVAAIKDGRLEAPLFLFVDCYSSHYSLEVAQFCKSNGIELMTLYPNSTFLMQPLDAAVFGPMKNTWGSYVLTVGEENFNFAVTNQNFNDLMSKFMKQFKSVFREKAIEGFKQTGLCPFNPEAVDYGQLLASCRKRTEKKGHETESPHKLIFDLDQYPEVKGMERVTNFTLSNG